MPDLRVGLIGCGRHGERYLRHLARGDVDGMRAVALWRRDRDEAERLANEYSVDAARSLDELLGGRDLDGVVIATPPGGHAEQLRAAAASGLGALIEKPLVANWDEARELAAVAGMRAMVAQTLRFSPTLRRARDLLPALGAVHRIRMVQRLEPSDLAWQRDRSVAGGGSVLLTGVHLFDLLRWFVGRTPDAVSARTCRIAGHPLENLFDARFEYDDPPLLAATEVSKFSSGRLGRLEVVGEEGELHVDYLRGTLEFLQGREVESVPTPGDLPTLPIALGFFGAMLRGEIDPPITIGDGIETVRMAEACYRSHASGRVVRLDELDG